MMVDNEPGADLPKIPPDHRMRGRVHAYWLCLGLKSTCRSPVSTSPLTISDADLPALFRAADALSVNAQRRYLRLIRADLIAIFLGALLSAFDLENPLANRWLMMASALLLLVGVILTILLHQKPTSSSGTAEVPRRNR
jgi:hypothetical protein